MTGERFDVVVVGGGSAGCVLAARLAEKPGRSVLLLEAGPDVVSGNRRYSDDCHSQSSLAATVPGHPLNWGYEAELVRGVPAVLPRGRVLGGSSAINGAYFVRATRADLDGWGVPGLSYDEALPFYVRSERDADFDGPDHGRTGPVPVRRPSGALVAPTTGPFLAAAAALGFPDEPDKNADGPPGAGLVPSNAVEGVRVSAADAYLRGRPAEMHTSAVLRPADDAQVHLAVRTDTVVTGIVLDRVRAVGVRTADGVVEAGEVVLAAGALATPRLLMRAGIGPGEVLRQAGIRVRHDLPVGQGFSDHPAVFLPFRPHETAEPHPHAVTAQVALHLDSGADPAGDLELLLFSRPFTPGGPLHVMCALQRPERSGVLTPDRTEHRYLRTEADRRRLRAAVRIAADLLRAGLGTRVEPEGFVLGNDARLDGWIRDHLTTSSHLSGTAAIGPVTDPGLRVRGTRGLRVVDTSVFPAVPRRGPAASAIMLGEYAAALPWDG
ncbi:FAD-dependent oxidoreductase [Pseudonocardia sp. N23]|uniref:FAD-dependent oxidoreductase n=1 Tax=Pseudonocardia sp. N23 TaxID=1987376 RepID=UPI00209BDF76|nr:FAD-dependent oxidoreductase [Pseudonocardia sp. N23]